MNVYPLVLTCTRARRDRLLHWHRRVEQVRALMRLNDASGPLRAASAFLLLASGPYMALTQWSLQTPWIRVALISVLVMVPASAVVLAPRRAAIVRQIESDSPT
jgi:hypothetical protein